MSGSINKTFPQNKTTIYTSGKLPDDFFASSAKSYHEILDFNNQNFVKIDIGYNEDELLSNLQFTRFKSFKSATSNSYPQKDKLIILFDNNRFAVVEYGSFKNLILTNQKMWYPLDELTNIIKEIVTYQYTFSIKNQSTK